MNHPGVMGLAVLFAAASATGAVLNVSKTADTADGTCNADCSLREAIRAANANPNDADTINIPAGTYTLTRSGANENAAQTGDLDILGPVTLVGAGAATTIVQAGTTSTNGIDKVFSVNPNFDHAFATSISSMTIRNGRNPSAASGDGFGGGLDWEASGPGTLTISDCVIADNSTTDGDGGGLAATNGPGSSQALVTISNTTFSNNRASRASSGGSGIGGAIFVGAVTPIVLNNCTFTDNQAIGADARGGALFIFGPAPGAIGPYGIRGCSFTGNQAGDDGGAIYSTAPVTLDQACVIADNISGNDGGGIWLNHSQGTTTILESTIMNNSAAAAGGGIRLDIAASQTLNVAFCRIVGNAAPAGSAVSRGAGTFTAENNWWGTNGDPTGMIAGVVNYDPWLQLDITSTSTALLSGGQTATLTAELTRNSDGFIPAGGVIPDGIPITFTGVNGAVDPVSTNMSAGAASSTFTTGFLCGSGSGQATVDAQTASVDIAITATTYASADFNFDCVVDLNDHALLEACATGPEVPYNPLGLPVGCAFTPDGQGHIAPDLDADGDVDQADFAIYQRCIRGSNQPADPHCAD